MVCLLYRWVGGRGKISVYVNHILSLVFLKSIASFVIFVLNYSKKRENGIFSESQLWHYYINFSIKPSLTTHNTHTRFLVSEYEKKNPNESNETVLGFFFLCFSTPLPWNKFICYCFFCNEVMLLKFGKR